MRRCIGKLGVIGALLFLTACATTNSSDTQKAVTPETIETLKLSVTSGENFYKAGKLEDAKKAFLEVLSIDPNNIVALYRLGHIEFRENNLDAAEQYFTKVVQRKPRYEKAYYNLAVLSLIKAEKNLQFYSATTDPDTNLDDVSLMLKYISQFASGNLAEPETETKDELQELVNIIQDR